MNNPKNKKMLNDFINHLDKRGSHFGWYLISKESYKNFIVQNFKRIIHAPKTR